MSDQGVVAMRGVFFLEQKEVLANAAERLSGGEKSGVGEMRRAAGGEGEGFRRLAHGESARAGGSFLCVTRAGKLFLQGPDALPPALSCGSSLTKNLPLELENVHRVACGAFHVIAWNNEVCWSFGYNLLASNSGLQNRSL